jgi:hypothetical protein
MLFGLLSWKYASVVLSISGISAVYYLDASQLELVLVRMLVQKILVSARYSGLLLALRICDKNLSALV